MVEELEAPEPGDFVAMAVGMPGPDIDYGICIKAGDGKTLVRYQVWQQLGPWEESWFSWAWKAKHLHKIGDALKAERDRLFPAAPSQGEKDATKNPAGEGGATL